MAIKSLLTDLRSYNCWIPIITWLFLFVSTGKPVSGVNERGGKNPFQGSSPPFIRKYRQVVHCDIRENKMDCLPNTILFSQCCYVNVHNLLESSRAALPAGFPDRGREKEKTGSFQLLPSRPAPRLGTSNPDAAASGAFGHSRSYKPSLTVEEVTR